MMKTENPAQIIEELKAKLGQSPEKFVEYEKEGDEYYAQEKYEIAAGIYTMAIEIKSDEPQLFTKRNKAIKKWLDII